MKSLIVESKPTSRMMYIVLDASGRTGPDSPFKELKVRQAIAHAIDRQGIVTALVQGGAQVLHAFCFPQDFGCPKDVVQYDYDPAKARQLLSEAGYPNGFEATFSAWRDRPYVEAIMSNLADVGIKVTLNFTKLAPLRGQWEKGELPMVYGSIGSRVEDIGNFVPTFFGKSKRDIAQDDEVAALLSQAGSSMDEEVRRQLNYQALRRIAKEALAVPMFSDNMNFVMSSKVQVPSDSGGTPHFYRAEWR
jgi:peptide/nickel transport system substrate-binding protein